MSLYSTRCCICRAACSSGTSSCRTWRIARRRRQSRVFVQETSHFTHEGLVLLKKQFIPSFPSSLFRLSHNISTEISPCSLLIILPPHTARFGLAVNGVDQVADETHSSRSSRSTPQSPREEQTSPASSTPPRTCSSLLRSPQSGRRDRCDRHPPP